MFPELLVHVTEPVGICPSRACLAKFVFMFNVCANLRDEIRGVNFVSVSQELLAVLLSASSIPVVYRGSV
jgi:hypothetical protein